ncbi:MAG: alpha/beta fold hydrolase, partial [Deltaproteobacteria bacterium]|nr:alpha/beta fold hydrolase [Deltaproteobacteria bacterium]
GWNLGEVVHDRKRIDDRMRRAYFDRLRTDGALEAQAAVASAIDEPGLRARFDHLAEIRIPTLILWGEQDRWIPVSVGRALQREIPGSQLHVLPRSGHLLQEERPEQVAALIAQFLTQPAPPATRPASAR